MTDPHREGRSKLSIAGRLRGAQEGVQSRAEARAAERLRAAEQAAQVRADARREELRELRERTKALAAARAAETEGKTGKVSADARKREQSDQTKALADARTAEIEAKAEMKRSRLEERKASREARVAELREHETIFGPKNTVVTWDGQALEIRRGWSKVVREIDPSVQAAVESAGNLTTRTSLTRAVVGTAIAPGVGTLLGMASRKKVDARELYLVVESDEWAELIQLNPKHGEKARRLAQKLNFAARQAQDAEV